MRKSVSGHGESAGHERLHHFGIRDYAHDVAHAVGELPARPVLIGHSMGGYFATYLATRHDLKAVLVNPVVRGYEIMCEFYGPVHNPHTGRDFDIDETDIDYLLSIYLETLAEPSRFLLMQQHVYVNLQH